MRRAFGSVGVDRDSRNIAGSLNVVCCQVVLTAEFASNTTILVKGVGQGIRLNTPFGFRRRSLGSEDESFSTHT